MATESATMLIIVCNSRIQLKLIQMQTASEIAVTLWLSQKTWPVLGAWPVLRAPAKTPGEDPRRRPPAETPGEVLLM